MDFLSNWLQVLNEANQSNVMRSSNHYFSMIEIVFYSLKFTYDITIKNENKITNEILLSWKHVCQE